MSEGWSVHRVLLHCQSYPTNHLDSFSQDSVQDCVWKITSTDKCTLHNIAILQQHMGDFSTFDKGLRYERFWGPIALKRWFLVQ